MSIHRTDFASSHPRDGPELLLEYPERKRPKARLPDLPSMGIGVEAVIADSDLAFIRNMGSDPGYELQVVHPLDLFGLFPIPVADLACRFIEGEALQGQKGSYHVFSHPLGFFFCLGPDPAMDIEPRMCWAKKGIFSFSYLPLEWISYLAIFIVLLAAVGILIHTVAYFLFHKTPPGIVLAAILILFLGGIQLLSLSIIGEYLGRVFEEVKRRPKYIIRNILNDHRREPLISNNQRPLHAYGALETGGIQTEKNLDDII